MNWYTLLQGEKGSKGDSGPMGLPGPMGFRGESATGKPGKNMSIKFHFKSLFQHCPFFDFRNAGKY